MATPPRSQGRPAPGQNGPTREEIEAYARESARRHGVPEDVGVRQVFAESSFRANPPSPPGVVGPMQVKPGTAAKYRLDPHDWRQNIDAGFAYDRDNLKRFNGDLAQMASAYNSGPDSTKKDAQGVVPGTYPYVSKLLPGWKPGTDQRFIAPGYPGGAPLEPAPQQPASPAPAQARPPAAPPQSGSAAAPPHRLGFFDPRNGAPPPGFGLLSDPNFPGVFTHQTPWGDVWPLLPGPNRRGPKG